MEKHLRVNTSVFDMISTTPEIVEAFDQIKVNCSICLTTAKTRALLSSGTFGVNTSLVVDVGNDENVKVMNFNGMKVLNANAAASKEPAIIVANGALIIEDSDTKSFDRFKGVYVNGVVVHPKSLDTSNFMVNGAMIPYPDGAILMFQELHLTSAFLKSAPQGSIYFVQGIPSNMGKMGKDLNAQNSLKETGILAVEPLDLDLLESKNVRFETNWVTVSEDHAEKLLPLVDGYIGMTIIPSGFSLMRGGKLDRLAVRRFGTRIYVDGDLQIHAEEADALEAVDQLQVSGRVIVADRLADAFFDKCSQYGDLTVYQGEWMEYVETEIHLDRELLEEAAEGATIRLEDANAEIAEDMPMDLLSKKLHGIILKGSSLTLGLRQQRALRKKIENHDSDLIIREHIQQAETKQEPETKSNTYTETRINTSYYKL